MGARMARIGIVDIYNTFIDYYTQMNETRWTIYYGENTLAFEFEFDSFIFELRRLLIPCESDTLPIRLFWNELCDFSQHSTES